MPSFQGTLDRAQAESPGRYVRDLAKQRGG
jgi:hypothetical protein